MAFIEPVLPVRAVGEVQPGVARIGAQANPIANIDGQDDRVQADIAVIDTGIDLDHPDLNVVADRNFVDPTRSGDDDHFHGTHVAGIAAALDNGAGVVGVAPGARLWAIKVLDQSGWGTTAEIIAGIDYVTAHADQIAVANMSLGGWGRSRAWRTAIQNSVNAGVVYVAAAGNDAFDLFGAPPIPGDFFDFMPAAFPEVAAVSAMADTDGDSGGQGPDSSSGPDDTFALFSNFSRVDHDRNPVRSPGAAIDLAAPGVDVLSTIPGGQYGWASGTSMAAPHVAGAIALHIAEHGRAHNAAEVYAIRQALIDGAQAQSAWRTDAAGDPDDNPESLVWVDPGPPPAPTCGDGVCSESESCVGCAVDCGSCGGERVTLFEDSFDDDLSRWTQSGDGKWALEFLHREEGYPPGGSQAPAAHADNCRRGCTLTLATAIDLQRVGSPRLELLRFVDDTLDRGEYLRVEGWDGSAWRTLFEWTAGADDDDLWHAEAIDLGPYASADFRVRISTRENRHNEHVQVDDIRITGER